jgi:hypothetical protein
MKFSVAAQPAMTDIADAKPFSVLEINAIWPEQLLLFYKYWSATQYISKRQPNNQMPVA